MKRIPLVLEDNQICQVTSRCFDQFADEPSAVASEM